MSFPPQIALTSDLHMVYGQATLALGRLDALSHRPAIAPLLEGFIRNEATWSATLEGDAGVLTDAQLATYQAALDWGLLQLRNGFPLSTRLLRGIYAKLADTHAAPPLSDSALEAMAALERFLTDVPERTPPLLKAALAHAQFTRIAPFPDGNGRMSRLLVLMILCADHVLREPWLTLSRYFTQHRATHDALLTQLRETGDWNPWLGFFARGVAETATNAVRTTDELVSLLATDRERVAAAGRPTKSTLAVFDALRERPINKAPLLAEQTGLTLPTVITALERLQALGIVDEITGKRRNRTYRYSAYILRLSEGTEPI